MVKENFCLYVDKSVLNADQRYTAAHNFFRCKHNVPQMRWDPAVAFSAHDSLKKNCDISAPTGSLFAF